jgi:hypothetical protein
MVVGFTTTCAISAYHQEIIDTTNIIFSQTSTPQLFLLINNDLLNTSNAYCISFIKCSSMSFGIVYYKDKTMHPAFVKIYLKMVPPYKCKLIMCIYVMSSVLWCPLRCTHKHDVIMWQECSSMSFGIVYYKDKTMHPAFVKIYL